VHLIPPGNVIASSHQDEQEGMGGIPHWPQNEKRGGELHVLDAHYHILRLLPLPDVKYTQIGSQNRAKEQGARVRYSNEAVDQGQAVVSGILVRARSL
jgi:hypothetical protein